MQSGLGDDLLDYIQAGPKMRRWYGETDKLTVPRDGGSRGSEEEEDGGGGERDAVLVTDADSPLGELVLMQLVVARTPIRALVRDGERIKQQFGPYVTVIQGGADSWAAVRRAMSRARAVIVTGPVGQAARAAGHLGIRHLVLLSSAGHRHQGLPWLGGLFGGSEAAMRDPGREAEARGAGVPCTILRFPALHERPGGAQALRFRRADTPASDAAAGAQPISREDCALVAARCLLFPPGEGQCLEVAVEAAGPGFPPEGGEAWAHAFRACDGSRALEGGAPRRE